MDHGWKILGNGYWILEDNVQSKMINGKWKIENKKIIFCHAKRKFEIKMKNGYCKRANR